MIVLAVVTAVLAITIWWALIHAPTYEIVDTTEFQKAVAQLRAGIQKFAETLGTELLPAMRAGAIAFQRLGEALAKDFRDKP